MTGVGTSLLSGWRRFLGRARLGRGLLDLILPPRCLACGLLVSEPGTLCSGCWPRLTFLGAPHCACCGLPFDYDQGPEARCAACLADPPPFDRARAVLRYDEASRGMILAFKHADRTDSVPAFARWLARAGQPLLDDCDLIVPVPLHWRRLFRRRYNQSALLALRLGRLTGKAVAPGLLQRRKNTRPQGHLSRRGRQRNVAGAFALTATAQASVKGRRILLIDDVLTTGATLNAASEVLLRAGAAGVDVLTLARVVRTPT